MWHHQYCCFFKNVQHFSISNQLECSGMFCSLIVFNLSEPQQLYSACVHYRQKVDVDVFLAHRKTTVRRRAYLLKAFSKATISCRVSWKPWEGLCSGSFWISFSEKRIFRAVPRPWICTRHTSSLTGSSDRCKIHFTTRGTRKDHRRPGAPRPARLTLSPAYLHPVLLTGGLMSWSGPRSLLFESQ